MNDNKKRKNRGYKATDIDYNRATRRAKKEKTHLATLLERVVIAYGQGYVIGWESNEVELVKIHTGKD